MSAYDALRPEVKAVVDRNAEAIAAAYSITVDEAREIIAKRVKTVSSRPTNGMGH